MKFWHRTQQALPKFHFGTPLSVNRKMKDALKIIAFVSGNRYGILSISEFLDIFTDVPPFTGVYGFRIIIAHETLL